MDTALLIVDVQTSLVDEGPHDADGLIERINRLIAAARQAGATIVFVRDTSVEPDGSVHPRLDMQPGDLQSVKDYCDSFLQTDLQAQLEARGVRRLVIAGMQTEYCIDTTVRSAAAHGYQVTLVSDAHTTFDSDLLAAPQIIAHHNHILNDFVAGEGRVALAPAAEVRF